MLKHSLENQIKHAAFVIKQGGVVAYPTESCFGLGCDILNETAIARILNIKGRSKAKGLIMIAHHSDMLRPYIDVNDDEFAELSKKWPGAYTWLVTKTSQVSDWVSGESSKVAVRVPNHDTARSLSNAVNMPVISTSANPQGLDPAKNKQEVMHYFYDDIDYIIDAPIGNYAKPSVIYDFVTKKAIRS